MRISTRQSQSSQNRQGDSVRSELLRRPDSQNGDHRNSPRPSLSNQAALLLLREKMRRERDRQPVEEPRTPEEDARQLLALLQVDPMDQSGQVRNRLQGLDPEVRTQVLQALQSRVSETQWVRLQTILQEPAPRTPRTPLEAPAPERPAESPAEAAVQEQIETVQSEAEKPPQPLEAEPATRETRPQPVPEIERAQEESAAVAAQAAKAAESVPESHAEVPADGPREQASALPEGGKLQPSPEATSMAARGGQAPATQAGVPAAMPVSARAKADQEPPAVEGVPAAAAAGPSRRQKIAGAKEPGAAGGEQPAQAEAQSALSQLSPTDAAGAAAPAASPGPAARSAAIAPPSGPAPAPPSAEAGGGGGDAAVEEALDGDGAGETGADAEAAEERMEAAEPATEEEEAPPAEAEPSLSVAPTAQEEEAAQSLEDQPEEAGQQAAPSEEGGLEAGGAQAEEGEPEAAPAAQADVPAQERDAGLSALADDVGGGGEGGGGGGGGGGAVPEPQVEEPPDVSQAEPTAAMASVSGLSVGGMSRAISGVSAAASRSVGDKRQELAANPPQMERPSGSPATRQTPIAAAGSPASAATPTRVERAEAGGPAATPEPEPLPAPPPSPADQVRAPRVAGDTGGQMSPADAENLREAVRNLPTTDPALAETAGPAPTLALEGDADPARAREQRNQLDNAVAQQQTQGAADVAEPMGEGEIYPTVPEETLRGETPAASQAAPAAASGEAADETAAIVAEERDGDTVRAAATQARADMQARQQEHLEQESEERTHSQEEVQGLVEANASQQEEARTNAQQEVQQARGDWSQEQRNLVDRSQTEADQANQEGDQEVSRQERQANTEAARHVEQGNRQAGEARRTGEATAARERTRAENESSGVLGWLASRATAFFNSIKQAVHRAFEAARAAVRSAIERATQLATAAIEAARRVVVAAIRRVGDALIAIGDRLLAGFPGLRDRFRRFIQERVAAAERFVNRLAENLRRGVTAFLSALGAALDAALGLLERGLMAAIDAVNSAVQGAIRAAQAVVEALGTFAALIRDIAANPGQWISNLGAAVVDGIRNHLWTAFKAAIRNWFNQKLEEVLGVGMMIWNLIRRGGIQIAQIGRMAFEALKSAIPGVLIALLIEKLVSMIVPAAGAVMAIIEGLQAAWGTISRIIQAISRFIAFLRAVKTGNAGPQFASALAAAAIVVIDFVANWLIRRLRRPAGRVAGRIRTMARRIMARLRRVARRVGRAIRRVARRVRRGIRRVAARFRRRRRRRQQSPRRRQRAQERLRRAVSAIRPQVTSMLRRGIGRTWLRARLLMWRVRYRLSALRVQGNRIVARVNPEDDVTTVEERIQLGQQLEPILRAAEDAYLRQYEQSRMADDARAMGMSSDQPGPGYIPRNPEIEDILTMRRARSGEEGLRRHESLRLRSTDVTMTSASQRSSYPWWDPNPAALTDFRVPAGREASYAAMQRGWEQRGMPSVAALSESRSLRSLGLLERARGPGMLPAMDVAGALGRAGLANAAEITYGGLAPMAPGSAAQATEDEARQRLRAQSTAEGRRLPETVPGTAPRRNEQQLQAARDQRHERIANIFLRLRQVVQQPQPIATTPGTTGLPALARAFQSWLRARLNPDPNAFLSASAGLAQQLVAFLRTYRGG